MQRQLKFRCFDTYTGRYIPGFRLGQAREYPVGIVEQCTGLKDREGTLIYDGDIVEHNVRYCVVEWYKGGFWVNTLSNGVKWHIHLLHSAVKVVGNIHENYKLLRGNK